MRKVHQEKKPPSRSGNARKTLVHVLEGIETNLSGFMAQVLELLQKLNEKVDNNTTRLFFLEKMVRELKKEMHLMRMGNKDMAKEEEDKENAKEDEEEKGEKGIGEEGDKEKDQGVDGTEQEKEDSSEMESDNFALLRTTGYKYALYQREAKKFSNTIETALVWTPFPPPSQQPTTQANGV